jgi:uncharacterized Zn-binding protein involved in type VI secretion
MSVVFFDRLSRKRGIQPSRKKLIDPIRLGDTTNHRGTVVSASATTRFDSRAAVRNGHEVSRLRHDIRSNLILDDDASVTDGGVPIARPDSRTTCGHRLLSTLI